jgi:hypothetical protein
MTADQKAAARLREARAQAGFESSAAAARALGVKEAGYTHHENGQRGFAHKAAFYAERFGVAADWLMTGRGPKSGASTIEMKGAIGAGEKVEPADDQAEIARGEWVELPRPRDAEAFVVRGDSMQPRFFRGEILIFDALPTRPESRLVGQICRIRLPDGASYVKVLFGAEGAWRLHSMRFGEPVIEVAEIRSVYRWRALLPPRRAHVQVFAPPTDA